MMRRSQEYFDRLKQLIEDENACADMRTDSFKRGFPSSGFVYWDIKFNPPVKIENASITKIRLLRNAKDTEDMVIVMTHDDGKRSVKTIKRDFAKSFFYLFEQLDVSSHRMFLRMNRKRLKWEEESMSAMYQKEVERSGGRYDPNAHYDQLHAKLKTAILYIINQDHLTQLNIIDGGCGNGKLLKLLEKEINLGDIRIHFAGFDFNEKNILECQEGYVGHCQFMKGDLHDINTTFHALDSSRYIDKAQPSILILSGSMTRLVFDDAIQAVNSLQQIALNHVDYIIGGGVGEPLFNYHIAKRIGYEMQPIPNVSLKENNFFSLRKMPLEKILENKIKKINKKNILDLSFAPNPEFILAKIMELDKNGERKSIRDGLTIDLSYCHLDDGLLHRLNNVLDNYKNIKLIFWHWDVKNLEKFVTTFSSKAYIQSLRHVYEEAFLMAPKAFFATIHDDNEYNLDDVSSSGPDFSTLNIPSTLFSSTSGSMPEVTPSSNNEILKKLIYNIGHMGDYRSWINEAIFKNLLSMLGLPSDLEKIRITIFQRLYSIDRTLPQHNDILTNQIIFDNKRPALKLDHVISELKKNMVEKISPDDFSDLPQLLYLLLIGIHITYSHNNYTHDIQSGANLKEEIELYHMLSQMFPSVFDFKLMLQLAETKLNSIYVDPMGSAKEMGFAKELDDAKKRFADFTSDFNTVSKPKKSNT